MAWWKAILVALSMGQIDIQRDFRIPYVPSVVPAEFRTDTHRGPFVATCDFLRKRAEQIRIKMGRLSAKVSDIEITPSSIEQLELEFMVHFEELFRFNNSVRVVFHELKALPEEEVGAVLRLVSSGIELHRTSDRKSWDVMIREDSVLEPSLLKRLASLDKISGISLSNRSITSDTFQGICQIARDLNGLDLDGSSIADSGLVHIRSIGSIREICIPAESCTDVAFESICELKNCEFIIVRCSNALQAGEFRESRLAGIRARLREKFPNIDVFVEPF